MNHSALNNVLAGLFALSVLLTSKPAIAESDNWIPKSSQEVVLTYQPKPDSEINSEINVNSHYQWKKLYPVIKNLLTQSSLPGNSYLEQQAQLHVSEWNNEIEQNSHQLTPDDIAQLALFNAQLLQKKHRFTEALQKLKEIHQSNQLYAQALLIESRIHHIQGRYDLARQSCGQLLSQKLPLYAQLCLIETEALAGQPKKAYKLLNNFKARYLQSSDEVLIWYHQVAGTIARLLSKTSDAEQHFSIQLNQAPNSQWFQWADMALENNNAQLVLTKLKQLERPDVELEDGLIIRIARAEKIIANNTRFQSLAKQRIELRVKRNDQLHAADIAYYYVHIDPQPEQALYWSERNWQTVKEPADSELLKLAQQLNTQRVNHD